jgi:hypothetical protein
VYSLGNLVFGGNGRSSYNTGLFEILIGSGDTAYRFIPIAVRDWRLSVLHGDDSAAVVQQVERRSTGFQSIPLNQGEP